MSPFDKAWSPYVAGILIGLLQIPAFLIIETALGASSSYVTVGAGIAGLFDASLLGPPLAGAAGDGAVLV